MANRARGVIAAKIGDEIFEISLGLGALAEIEDAFNVEAFEDALNFGERVSAKRLQMFMSAVLKGNGVDMTPERMKAVSRMTVPEFMEMVVNLMSASGMSREESDKSEKGEANSPLEEETDGAHG